MNALSWGGITETKRGPLKQFKLHRDQSILLRNNSRFRAGIAGTGGGKTVCGPIYCLMEMNKICKDRNIEDHPIKGLVVAPTFKIMERATLPTLIDTFKGTTWEGTFVKPHKYILPGKAGVIWCLSADDPNSLEGGQFDFIWGDEAGQMKYGAHLAMLARGGVKQAPILYTTTPYSMNWLYHDWYKRWLRGEKDYFIHNWSSIHNPAYPKESYEHAKRTLSPQKFRERYLGEFVNLSGLVLPDLSHCFVDLKKKYPKGLPDGYLYGGIDWGFNDPFACLAGVLDPETDDLIIYYERYKSQTLIQQHGERIPKGVTYSAGKDRPDGIRELQEMGHEVFPVPVARVSDQIERVNSRVYRNKLWITNRARALMEESSLWSYPNQEDGKGGDKPVDGDDHACSALLYLVSYVDRHIGDTIAA